MISFKTFLDEEGAGLWANIRKRKASGKRMRKKGEKGAPTAAAMKSASEGSGKKETWEDGYKRRVVQTSSPEHKDKGFNWRIKGKDRDEVTIKLYKSKPDFKEYTKQMKRGAGHEFG